MVIEPHGSHIFGGSIFLRPFSGLYRLHQGDLSLFGVATTLLESDRWPIVPEDSLESRQESREELVPICPITSSLFDS